MMRPLSILEICVYVAIASAGRLSMSTSTPTSDAVALGATLTMLQMVFCSIAARLCVLCVLADPSSVGYDLEVAYIKIVIPLALLYCFYLYGSNAVYDYFGGLHPVAQAGPDDWCLRPLLLLCGKERHGHETTTEHVNITGGVLGRNTGRSRDLGWSTWGFVLMAMTLQSCYPVSLRGSS